MLKVIGGSLKSRLLKTPKGAHIRPTLALVRKALFDSCQEKILGARFLDLCSGSGAIAIEALSRGALFATLVDCESLSIFCMWDNLKALDLSKRAVIMHMKADKAVKLLAQRGALFEMIYLDLPYREDPLSLLEAIDRACLLAPGGKVFLEKRGSMALSLNSLCHLRIESSRKFNDTQLLTLIT